MKSILEKIKGSKKLQIIIGIVVLLLAFIIYSIVNAGYSGLGQKSAENAMNISEDAVDSLDDMESNAESNSMVENYGEDVNATEEDMSSDNFVSAQDENQKLVYSGNLTINSSDTNKTYKEVMTKMKEFDGKLEEVNQYEDEIYLSVRIKKDNFTKFYESLKDVSGDVTHSTLSVDDMTKQYVNNSRKLETLQAEYDDLKALMSKAETVDEVLTIRDRLSDLVYQMDSLEQSNNDIDYDADFSTITITIEKAYNGSYGKLPFGKQLKEAFLNGIELIEDFIIFLVNIWWIILAAILIIFRKRIFRKRIKSKNINQNLETDFNKEFNEVNDIKPEDNITVEEYTEEKINE